MYILPVVDHLEVVFGVVGDAAAQVHGELSDVAKTKSVADLLVDAEQFSSRVLHEIYSWQCVCRRTSAGLDEPRVQ